MRREPGNWGGKLQNCQGLGLIRNWDSWGQEQMSVFSVASFSGDPHNDLINKLRDI